MEKRILIALALSFLVLMLTRPWWEPQRSSVPPSERSVLEKKEPGKPASFTRADVPVGLTGRDQQELKRAEAEESIDIETDVYKVKLSNKEAVVRSWVLKKYNDSNGKPLEFVDDKKAQQFGYPLSVKVDKDDELTKSLKTALFTVTRPDRIDSNAPGLKLQDLNFEFSDGNLQVLKKLSFAPGSYWIRVESKVWINGKPIGHFLNWNSGFGDSSVDPRMAVHKAVYRLEDKIKRLKDSEVSAEQELSGLFDYAGLEDLYFAALFLPGSDGPLKRIQFSRDEYDGGTGKKEKLLRAGAFSTSLESQGFKLFVGPKDTEVLRSAGSHLVEVIDYGWFRFACEPLFLALKWLHSFVKNYGLAIIMLTILINIALFPLKYKSIISAQKMQKLQPQMKAIQEKYKKYKSTDPKRQQMNSEVMALYKAHGVNPLGGCLPLVLQMPFFIAFYNLLSVAIELRHAPFVLWIRDLSAADQTFILPILMTISMVAMQKMTPTPSADPVQAKMMMAMPVFFGFMLAFTSSGLVLYWLTSNLVGIAQQYFMNKYGPSVSAGSSGKRAKK